MANMRILAIAFASSALVAAPAQAGGLLSGGGNCLCQAVGGVLGSGAPGVPAVSNPAGTITGTLSRANGSGLSRHGSL